jgi:membrane-associated protein
MNYGAFTFFNVLGAVVWGVGLTLLGYWLGQFQIIQDLLEPIVIAIVVVSALPMFIEWYRRRKAAKRKAGDAA